MGLTLRGSWPGLFAVVVMALCSSCLFDPFLGVQSCDLTCDSACPDGFECTPDGFCVEPGYTRACTAPLRAVVDTEATAVACEGFDIPLEHVGGGGPITWDARSSLPAGVELVAAEAAGDSPRLVGREGSLEARPYLLKLRVSDNHNQSDDVDVVVEVVDCLSVENSALPGQVCVGEPFELGLAAAVTGGYGHVSFRLLESSGQDLTIEQGVLSGAIAEAGSYNIELEVTDFELARDRDNDAGAAPALTETVSFALEAQDCLRLQPPVLNQPLCIGRQAAIPLAAQGGEGAYAFEVNGLPEGLWLDGDTIRGTTDRLVKEADVEIVVIDETGEEDVVNLTLATAECPSITTLSHQACEDRQVDFQLRGQGQGELLWDMPIGPTWLELANGRLRGTPPQADDYELLLSLSDDTGVEVEEPFSLQVQSGSSPACSAPLDVETSLLPDACVGQPYQAPLRAYVGDTAADWHIESGRPSWLTLDPDTNTLVGRPPADAVDSTSPLELRVEAEFRDTQFRTLPLRVRRSCKFALIDADSSLLLGDILATSDADPAHPTVTFSQWLADGERATLFAFSEDGRWLAFSTQLGDRARVYVYPVTAPLDERVPTLVGGLDDAVTVRELDFARGAETADRAGLAIASEDAAGAVRVTVVTQSDAFAAPTVLEVRQWLGGLTMTPEGLCYFRETAAGDGTGRVLTSWLCHELDATGRPSSDAVETDVVADGYYNEDFFREVHGQSVFMFFHVMPADQYQFREVIYDRDAPSLKFSHGFAVPDASLSFAAVALGLDDPEADGERRAIYPLDHSMSLQVLELPPAPQMVNGCAQVESWHQAGRALACVSTSEEQPLLIAVSGADASTVETRLVQDSAGYSGAHRHVFSEDGSVFIYDTGAGDLLSVDLLAETWTAVRIAEGSSSTTPVQLQPLRGGQLLYQRGDEVHLLDGRAGLVARLLPGGLALPYGCEPDFALAGPRRWCGSPTAAQAFSASPNARGVVLPAVDEGVAYVVDLDTAYPQAVGALNNVEACGPRGCAADVVFAP